MNTSHSFGWSFIDSLKHVKFKNIISGTQLDDKQNNPKHNKDFEIEVKQ